MQLSLLKMNSTGLLVKNWQFFLTGQQLFTGVVSGKFDAETKSATITFQEVHQLQPDGIVGNKTWGMAMQLGFAAINDPRTDRSGESFPPAPRFHPLIDDKDRQKVFGTFTFVSDPLPG
ncbi:MAG TPA: peptidoglycan-binding domain-containing protein, partial [Flavitalea sp.]|nr:peptidoglycan-binding domain-containing protein [Flavitalea sp.]